MGDSPASIIQLNTAPRIGLIRHVDVADFCAFALQRHKPEAEGKDGNKYEDAQADIKSGRLADERVITFRAQSYDVDKGATEKHLYGIQEDRIDLAFLFGYGDGGIALKDNAEQQ